MVDWNEKKGRMTKELLAPLLTPPMVEQVLFTDEIIAIMGEFSADDVKRVKIIDVLKRISDTPELVEDYKLWDQWAVKFVGEEWDNKFERMARNVKFIAGGCTQALQSLNNGVVSTIKMVIAALMVPKKFRRTAGSLYAALMVYCGIYPVKTCAVKKTAKAVNESVTANYMSINFVGVFSAYIAGFSEFEKLRFVGWGTMNRMRGEIDMLCETFGDEKMRDWFTRDMPASLYILAMYFYDRLIVQVKLIGSLLVFVPVDELILREKDLGQPANKQLGEWLDLLCGTLQMDEVEEFLLAFPEELSACVDEVKNLEIVTYLLSRPNKKEKKPRHVLVAKKIRRDVDTDAAETKQSLNEDVWYLNVPKRNSRAGRHASYTVRAETSEAVDTNREMDKRTEDAKKSSKAQKRKKKQESDSVSDEVPLKKKSKSESSVSST